MSYNTPVRHLQQGSVLEVAASGTALISSGGSIQVASGGVIQIGAGGSIVNAGANSNSGSVTFAGSVSVTGVIGAPAITLGGTLAKWAFGTAALTSGVGTIGVPGFTRVLAATSNVVLGEASGAGSTTSVQVDLSLSGAGSIIFHTAIGTLPGNVSGTVVWMALGT